MIEYDESAGRMVLKIVYYGPALSGKTTNLLRLHDMLCTDGRGDLMVLDTKDDRTIYFDLLPFFLTTPSGLKIKIKVYTVPGQVCHDTTRKAVLQRCDAVVFVADSQRCEAGNNAFSFENLEINLSLVGLSLKSVPLIVQFNKRDLLDISPEEEILHAWSETGIKVFFASALTGAGVMDTFSGILSLLYAHIDARYSLSSRHGLPELEFVKKVTRCTFDKS